jgi:hypothetical protein
MSETTSQTAIKIIAYVTGALISLAVLAVSLYKVVIETNNPIWWTMISSIISLYIPSPLQLTNVFNKSSDNTSTQNSMTALQQLKTIS